eukprot:m.107573 g.107573  ORF g.107573 m.107573 type:complete len:452 (+) comp10626_c0_seq3:148-1503(+)
MASTASTLILVFVAVLLCGNVFALDNGVGRTPMMGWMAWIRFRCNVNCTADPTNCVSEQLFKDMADRMVEDGWLDAGYEYVSIDDCWQAPERAPDGTMIPDPDRFPSGMKALGDYIHSKGLKFGLYTAMGEATCQGYPALNCQTVDNCKQAHQDVQMLVSYGIDYIKVDSCQGSNGAAFNTTHPLISSLFLEAGRAANRPVLYHPSGIALREGGEGVDLQYKLFGRIANMWRHYNDMQPVWSEVAAIIDFWAADNETTHSTHGFGPKEWENFLTVARPGVVQDPDALLAGNIANEKSCKPCLSRTGPGGFCPDREHPEVPCICCGTLTPAEELTNIVMWAMWSAPLEIAADLRSIPNTSAAVLKNKEIIAVNQDPLVYQARRAVNSNGIQVCVCTFGVLIIVSLVAVCVRCYQFACTLLLKRCALACTSPHMRGHACNVPSLTLSAGYHMY